MKSSIFNELNQEQQKAVRHTSGPSIILAGAGSGKTRVLTYKVRHLLEHHDIPESQIVMVTFTNKAAGEMSARVGKRLGFIGTFHSFCVSILRSYGEKIDVASDFVIFDRNDQEELVKDLLGKMNLPKKITPSHALYRISSAKDQLISVRVYEKFVSDRVSESVFRVYGAYQTALTRNNALDFDDLIFKAVKMLEEHPDVLEAYQDRFRYLLVDEFQDTNHAQYMLTKLLGQKYGNVTVVGDFSQSIYSWRGAEIRNLEKFSADFPRAKVFHLERNYRSTQNILDFAHRVIVHNKSHPILDLYTSNGHGDRVEVKELTNEQHEALYVAESAEQISKAGNLSDIAVLYRINAQSRVIEEAFLHLGIPYVLIGGTRFYERREIKDILSYVRLVVNPEEELSLKRVIKIGKKRYAQFKELYEKIQKKKDFMSTGDIIDAILKKTSYLEMFDEYDSDDLSRLENIKELRSVALNFPNIHTFLEQVALVESEYTASEKKKKEGVHLMTLHQAKGLEFAYVFIVGAEDGILPHSRSLQDFLRLEEERRLFYVGITRAQEKLYITYTKDRFFFGRRGRSVISRFLEDFVEHEHTSS